MPRYQRCKQKKRFAMTFDDGPVRYPDSPHPYLADGLPEGIMHSRLRWCLDFRVTDGNWTWMSTRANVPQLFGGPTATLLEQYGGKGTYFVNGYNSVCIYDQSVVDDLIRRYKAGHVIGSHSWNRESGCFPAKGERRAVLRTPLPLPARVLTDHAPCR